MYWKSFSVIQHQGWAIHQRYNFLLAIAQKDKNPSAQVIIQALLQLNQLLLITVLSLSTQEGATTSGKVPFPA